MGLGVIRFIGFGVYKVGLGHIGFGVYRVYRVCLLGLSALAIEGAGFWRLGFEGFGVLEAFWL